jgi:uncharacterized protein (TIGR02145 family)
VNGRSTAVFNTSISYGKMKDQDGNIYKTVQIGTQTWMAENLRTTKYRNGDLIPVIPITMERASLKTGGYCNYKNTKNPDTIGTFGRLYNWYTAADIRNVAPEGWHVSTDEDWTVLTSYLGETTAGGKLKEAGVLHWMNPNLEATNETGFTALPAGLLDNPNVASISFFAIGYYGEFWCVDEKDNIYAYTRNIASGFKDVLRFYHWKTEGRSIRCVKD